MNYKNLFTFLSVGLLSTFLLADNPGEDVVVVDNPNEDIVENASSQDETAVEEVVVPDDVASDNAGTSSENEEGAVVLEKVVVTGSRIKKSQIEGPLPLLIITKEDIDNSGFRNLTETLQSIPSANQSTQNESLNINFTPNANELDLRNLGPGRVLYLINGRRTADYPIPFNSAGNFANIGIIPSGLVDRIEVLSQGASAIYGSDAVTGVVNVITVKGKDFSELDFDISQTQYEQKNIYSLAFTTGGFFGNSSYTFGVDISHVDPMTYADRPGHDSFLNDPDYGSSYIIPRVGNFLRTDPFGGQRGFYSADDFPSTPSCSELSGGEFFYFDKDDPEWLYSGSYPGSMCGWDYGSERFGGSSQTIVNERDDIAIIGTFTHNFDNGVELNARLYAYHDEAFLRGIPRTYSNQEIYLDPLRIMALTSTSTDDANRLRPGAVQLGARAFSRDFTPSMGEVFDSRSDITEDVTDFFIGLNGFFDNGWEWEIGINTTEYEFENEQLELTEDFWDYMTGVGATDADGNLLTNTYRQYQYGQYESSNWLGRGSYSAFATAFGLPQEVPCGELVFGRYEACFLPERLYEAFTPEKFATFLADDSLDASSSQTSLDFLVTGEFELMNRFIGFAAIYEHQTQDYKLGPTRTDPNITFVQGVNYSGGGDRDRNSLGLEFSLPVSDKLELTIASRYDSYDDDSSNVGSRQSNMLNFAYRPNSSLLIRGSASETFRAPDMNYLFAGESNGYYNGVLDWVACYAYAQSGIRETDPTDPDFGELLYDYADLTECELGGVSVEGFFEGNRELEEEEGNNYQLGLVWDINDKWDFSLDLYQVLLENIIGRESVRGLNIDEGYCLFGDDFGEFILSENDEGRDCSVVQSKIGRADAGILNPVTGIPEPIGEWESVNPDFINQSFREYQGIDWTLNYRLQTENIGDFTFRILSSHIIAYYSKADENSDEVEWLSTYTYEPRSQQNMSINWRYQDFSTTLFIDRTGHMELGSRGKTDPHLISNISTSYNYSPDLNVYVSIRNLDDTMPQRDRGYSYPYYNRNYFSAFGRYYSAGFNYRF